MPSIWIGDVTNFKAMHLYMEELVDLYILARVMIESFAQIDIDEDTHGIKVNWLWGCTVDLLKMEQKKLQLGITMLLELCTIVP